MKPLLVGESNPYGGNESFALYPAPGGCSGHRLCCLILGMHRKDYLEAFDRCNLCRGKWSLPKASERVESLYGERCEFILCGAKVAAAFDVPFIPFSRPRDGTLLILPHPSGINRLWHQPGIIERARLAVAEFAPDVAPLIGRAVEAGR